MPDGSDDSKVGHDSLKDELNALFDEIKEEVTGNQRKELFRMAEMLSSIDIRVELCQIDTKKGKQFGVVIPISQFKELRKVLLSNI